MKITQKQRKKWLKQRRCHVCGSNIEGHTHPGWMWLANPIPSRKKIKFNEEEARKIITQELKIMREIRKNNSPITEDEIQQRLKILERIGVLDEKY